MPRHTTDRWYAEDGEYVQGLNEALRQRPTFGPPPTDQDTYYDSAPYNLSGHDDDGFTLPWVEGGRD